jgi:hypothetical protein
MSFSNVIDEVIEERAYRALIQKAEHVSALLVQHKIDVASMSAGNAESRSDARESYKHTMNALKRAFMAKEEQRAKENTR